MFWRRKKKLPEKPKWMDEHPRLWSELVPSSGEADTVQGELIRLTGRLTREALDNGNINWDSRPEEFKAQWDWVRDQLLTAACFSNTEKQMISESVHLVKDPDVIDDRLGNPHYFLSEKAVDFCRAYPNPIPVKNPKAR